MMLPLSFQGTSLSTYHAKGGCFLAPFPLLCEHRLSRHHWCRTSDAPFDHRRRHPPVWHWQQALDGLVSSCLPSCVRSNSFEVYWDMSDRSASRFTLCSAIAMLLCFIVYGSTAVFGYLDFGNRATVSALLLYNPVKEPEVMVAYIGFVGEALRLLPAHLHGHPQLPVPQCWVGPPTSCILEALRRRRQSCRCCTASRPVHPQYQHGVWLHWLILWRCNGVSSSLHSHDVRWQLVAAVIGWAHYTSIRAALCRCRHGGVRHRCHHLRRCGGRLSAAQCGAPARLRIHGRQQAWVCFCRTLLRYWAHWVQCEAGRALTIKTHLFPVPYTSVAERLCPFRGLFMF
ncbi:putative amino acid transporter [Trypanosoma cruzi]|uniref:Putative amino acid transporter n=1 Tax=Trypanosoma cruzi TaxID=5693 RepID=A0A2V2ULK4_TRYCR|nr:putative amino acid transporter [Trypanosoma cruzi]